MTWQSISSNLNVGYLTNIILYLDLIGLPSSQDEQEVVVSNPFLRKNISVNSEFDDPLEIMQAINKRFIFTLSNVGDGIQNFIIRHFISQL